MNPIFTYTGRPLAPTLRYFFWSHPEWWTVTLCGLAWVAMLFRWESAGHDVQHRMTFAQELVSWMLMVAAMMLPLVIHRVRATAVSSLWARRHRAIAGFLTGYFAPWLLLGMVTAGVREMSWTHTDAAAALGFLVAALWQLTPMHKRALMACHYRRPLAPAGWRADLDCLRFGGAISVACVGSCWPLMLACAFTGHALIAMTGGLAIGAFEKWPYRPRTRIAVAATLAIATCYAVLAVLDQSVTRKIANSAAPESSATQPHSRVDGRCHHM